LHGRSAGAARHLVDGRHRYPLAAANNTPARLYHRAARPVRGARPLLPRCGWAAVWAWFTTVGRGNITNLAMVHSMPGGHRQAFYDGRMDDVPYRGRWRTPGTCFTGVTCRCTSAYSRLVYDLPFVTVPGVVGAADNITQASLRGLWRRLGAVCSDCAARRRARYTYHAAASLRRTQDGNRVRTSLCVSIWRRTLFGTDAAAAEQTDVGRVALESERAPCACATSHSAQNKDA
jgi:hypothetical protein